MDGSVIEEKSSFKMMGLIFFSKLDWGSYIISIAKIVSKKKVFFIGITLVDVFQNWLNWFQFLFLEGGLLVILINCIIFLSPFVDITTMSMSTVSFLAELDS